MWSNRPVRWPMAIIKQSAPLLIVASNCPANASACAASNADPFSTADTVNPPCIVHSASTGPPVLLSDPIQCGYWRRGCRSMTLCTIFNARDHCVRRRRPGGDGLLLPPQPAPASMAQRRARRHRSARLAPDQPRQASVIAWADARLLLFSSSPRTTNALKARAPVSSDNLQTMLQASVASGPWPNGAGVARASAHRSSSSAIMPMPK